jgi:hypothetical protein
MGRGMPETYPVVPLPARLRYREEMTFAGSDLQTSGEVQ